MKKIIIIVAILFSTHAFAEYYIIENSRYTGEIKQSLSGENYTTVKPPLCDDGWLPVWIGNAWWCNVYDFWTPSAVGVLDWMLKQGFLFSWVSRDSINEKRYYENECIDETSEPYNENCIFWQGQDVKPDWPVLQNAGIESGFITEIACYPWPDCDIQGDATDDSMSFASMQTQDNESSDSVCFIESLK